MTEERWAKVPEAAKVKLIQRIDNFKVRCLDCFEQLTLPERLQNRSYCTACHPGENETDVL